MPLRAPLVKFCDAVRNDILDHTGREPKVVADAILKYGIDCEKPNPMTV